MFGEIDVLQGIVKQDVEGFGLLGHDWLLGFGITYVGSHFRPHSLVPGDSREL
jgi:hypothetical protein